MTRYILRRLLQSIVLLFIVSVVTFVLIHSAPGGPSLLANPELTRGGTTEVTVSAYLTTWLATVSVRPKTRRCYEQNVRCHLIPALGTIKLTRLQPADIRAMLAEKEREGLAPRTATLIRDVLRIALNQALRDGAVARNVALLVRRPKATRHAGPVLDVPQAQALLARVEAHPLAPVITIALALGLRQGEALGLQWKDIDLQGKTVMVHHALQAVGGERRRVSVKSDTSRRTLRLPALVVEALKRHRQRQAERRLKAGEAWQVSDYVFTTRLGRPLLGTNVTRDTKRLVRSTWLGGTVPKCKHRKQADHVCKACGARRLPDVTFHSLRHSCASLLLAQGVPVREVSELLGHSDIRLTLDVYAHVLSASRERTATAMDSLLGSNGSQIGSQQGQ